MVICIAKPAPPPVPQVGSCQSPRTPRHRQARVGCTQPRECRRATPIIRMIPTVLPCRRVAKCGLQPRLARSFARVPVDVAPARSPAGCSSCRSFAAASRAAAATVTYPTRSRGAARALRATLSRRQRLVITSSICAMCVSGLPAHLPFRAGPGPGSRGADPLRGGGVGRASVGRIAERAGTRF